MLGKPWGATMFFSIFRRLPPSSPPSDFFMIFNESKWVACSQQEWKPASVTTLGFSGVISAIKIFSG